MRVRARSLAALCAVVFAVASFGQAFEPGANVLTAGLGIGGHWGAYGTYSSQSPGIGIAYEKATSIDVGPGVLGLGGYLGYKSLAARERNGVYDYDFRWTYTILGFRGAYHWNEWHQVPELDTYGGLMLSYNVVGFKDRTDYPSGTTHYSYSSASGLGLSLYFGGRYYFTDKIGAYGELGYGIAYLTLGAAFNL
jgi:hypothetical protein